MKVYRIRDTDSGHYYAGPGMSRHSFHATLFELDRLKELLSMPWVHRHKWIVEECEVQVVAKYSAKELVKA